MTRTLLAIATATFLIAVALAPAAEACISCAYTPEVVNTPHPGAKQKKRSAGKPDRPAKKRIVKQPAPPKPVDTAKQTAPAKEVETAKQPEAGKNTETAKTEDANKDGVETAVTTPQAVDAQPPPVSGSATAALAEQEAARAKRGEPEPEVGCKKFSATAGTTVTVPCD